MSILKNHIKFILLIILLVWTGFIWHYSLEDAIKSSQRSQEVAETINETFEPEEPVTEHSVRKTAHFIEFMAEGVLALLCAFAFCEKRMFCEGGRAKAARGYVTWVTALLVGAVVAIADETLQLFGDGRSSQVDDVLLDLAGFCCGALLCAAAGLVVEKVYKRRKQSESRTQENS